MNLGLIVRQALGNAGLPDDAAHLELAKTDCNFVIQDYWFLVMAQWRQSRGQIVTESGADEYLLNKHFDRFVKNTLQGPSSNPVRYQYMETEEFFRLIRINSTSSSSPYIYTFGNVVGYDHQLNSASLVKVFSGLASKTVGAVTFTNGSDVVVASSSIFNLNDVGKRIKKDGDTQTYKIGKYLSPTRLQLLEKYRGVTTSNAAYFLGDVGIHVNIQGFVSGEIDSEDVVLDGSNSVVTEKTFNTITSISKSDRTSGKVTIQTQDGVQTLGSMAPGETEIERQTVLFWPKPGAEETLTYRFYMKHPILWLDSDRLLLPQKWHRLVAYKLEKRLRDSFGKDVPATLAEDITKFEYQFENEAEDMGLSDHLPDSDGERGHGSQYYYDHLDL